MPLPFPHFVPNPEERVDRRRIRTKNTCSFSRSGPIVYWMGRDRRVHDNWALRHAQELAMESGRPLLVLAIIQVPFGHAIKRQYDFSIEGYRDMEQEALERGISLLLKMGDPEKILPAYLRDIDASTLVTDLTVLRESRKKRERVIAGLDMPVYEVDAHNIVPLWVASDKKEYAAYTLRPKLFRAMIEFLTRFPAEYVGIPSFKTEGTDWGIIESRLAELPEHPLYEKRFSGTQEALASTLGDFLQRRLPQYEDERNNPMKGSQSDLSPYLHFGFIAPQRLALEIMMRGPRGSRDVFLEELLVRRELADNFCHFEPAYDAIEGFPAWARKTLEEHRKDKREYRYTLHDLREGRTHDPLWNAAQREMLVTGKMHGYMRMYWAKKILEWTEKPEEAMKIAIELNDTYELDGRDPNGYAGIAWSIGGVHDRAWFPRDIYGLVRYMSASGAKTKFDTKGYISRWNEGKSLFS